MTGHGSDYDQLRGLVKIFTERANQAIGQADEMTAMLQRTVDDSQEQWRDTGPFGDRLGLGQEQRKQGEPLLSL